MRGVEASQEDLLDHLVWDRLVLELADGAAPEDELVHRLHLLPGEGLGELGAKIQVSPRPQHPGEADVVEAPLDVGGVRGEPPLPPDVEKELGNLTEVGGHAPLAVHDTVHVYLYRVVGPLVDDGPEDHRVHLHELLLGEAVDLHGFAQKFHR